MPSRRLPATMMGWQDASRRLLAFFARAEPRGAPPSGWALAFDAAVAVGAAIGAVYEVATSGIDRDAGSRPPAW